MIKPYLAILSLVFWPSKSWIDTNVQLNRRSVQRWSTYDGTLQGILQRSKKCIHLNPGLRLMDVVCGLARACRLWDGTIGRYSQLKSSWGRDGWSSRAELFRDLGALSKITTCCYHQRHLKVEVVDCYSGDQVYASCNDACTTTHIYTPRQLHELNLPVKNPPTSMSLRRAFIAEGEDAEDAPVQREF
jgi:hypothetical protein